MAVTRSTDFPNNLREQNTASLDLEMKVIEGEIPSDLEGHAFWLVPTPQDGDIPWFNGYAQLYRLDFQSGQIHLKSEQFRTPSVICDQKINEQPWWTYLTNWRKLLFGGLYKFRNLGGLARLSPRLGVQNQCNTGLQAFKDPDNDSWRMFATIDSGRPFEFDLETLKPVTPIGERSEWVPLEINGIRGVGDIKIPWIFPMHMSGAHTAYDEDTKEVFIINCIFEIPSFGVIEPDAYIYVWDGKSRFNRTQIIDKRTNQPVVIKQSTHQIAITKNYVVIIDTAFRIEYLRMLDPDVKAKPQSAYNQVWLVPRAELQK
ncbi:MAG: carotenoid oxygenase family protein, partial [Symploca sp. SIO1A3]|nr:carotenoid oxygenase family protein [Symploca sp. SIO1A3]